MVFRHQLLSSRRRIFSERRFCWKLAYTLGAALWIGEAALTQSEPLSVPQSSAAEETKDSGSKLTLGRVLHSGEREVTIPLHFTAAEGETVGEIRAEVLFPEGPWRFQEVELPDGAFWKVSVRRRAQAQKREAGEPRRLTMLDVRFSAGSRAIRNGRIGSLLFSLSSAEVPDADSLRIAKLETKPPEPQLVLEPSETMLPPAAEPPINPAQGCFFFTH